MTKLKFYTKIALFFCLIMFLTSCGQKVSSIGKPQEIISRAWNEYRLGEYNKAIEIFSNFVNFSDSKEFMPFALYGLGCSYWQKLPDSDKTAAEKAFRRVITEYPDSEYAAWSELALVRMEHIVPPGQKTDYPSLREKYKALISKYKGTLPADEAFVYMVSTYVASFSNENEIRVGLELVNKFIEENPNSPYVSSVWTLRAKSCEMLGMPDEKLHSLVKALETKEIDPMNPHMENAGAYWHIAVTAEFQAGDFLTAKKFYQRLIDEYPREKRRFAANFAIKRIDTMLEKFEKEANR